MRRNNVKTENLCVMSLDNKIEIIDQTNYQSHFRIKMLLFIIGCLTLVAMIHASGNLTWAQRQTNIVVSAEIIHNWCVAISIYSQQQVRHKVLGITADDKEPEHGHAQNDLQEMPDTPTLFAPGDLIYEHMQMSQNQRNFILEDVLDNVVSNQVASQEEGFFGLDRLRLLTYTSTDTTFQ